MKSGSHIAQTPLRPPVLHILMALSEGALHGLGIADRVEETSGGVLVLGPGTLYWSLDDMNEAGLIQKVDAPTVEADPRRKYYAVTPRGADLLRAEMERLETLVQKARTRKILPGRV